jgi:hypothetical protein
MPNDSPSSDASGRCRAVRPVLIVLGLFVCGGASCRNLADQYAVPEPRVLQPGASLEAVMEVVNANSSRIQSLSASDCSLSTPMIPVALRTTIALYRPRRFRLRAEASGFTGTEVDLGSNEELFWFWVRRNQPPALYYCRHDQFEQSPARQVIPVEPEWLIEALGVTWFSPSEQHTGPAAVGGGRLRINSLRPTSQGPCTKVTVVDDAKGWVLEQHLYDPRGERIASALTSEHRRDPVANVVLPQQIEIQWPSTQVNLKIRVPAWRVNALDPNTPTLWTIPETPGWTHIDLGNPPIPSAVPIQPVQETQPQPQPQGWNGLRQ